MKKLIGFVLVFGGMLFVVPQPAQAIVFSDFVDLWDSFNVLGPGNTGSDKIKDGASNPDESWIHDILAEIAPNLIGNITISDAKLTISYKDVNTSNETWNVSGDGNALGSLANVGSTITTTDFNLTPAALAALQTDGIFNAGVEESTAGNDEFRLYQSTLSGNYTVNQQGGGNGVIPEPASMLLMGVGLAGFGLRSRRRAA